MDRRPEKLIAAALDLLSKRDAEDVSVGERRGSSSGERRGIRLIAWVARYFDFYFDFVEESAAGSAALLRGGPANRAGEIGQICEIVDGVRQRTSRLITNQLRAGAPGPMLRVTLRSATLWSVTLWPAALWSWLAAVEAAGLDWLGRGTWIAPGWSGCGSDGRAAEGGGRP